MTTPERPCPIASAVADAIIERSRVGLAKYGVNAARTDLTTLDWLRHLQEELMDAAVYVERTKQDVARLEQALDKITNHEGLDQNNCAMDYRELAEDMREIALNALNPPSGTP